MSKKTWTKGVSIYSLFEYFFASLMILQFRSIYIYCDEFRWATDRIFVYGILVIVFLCCALKKRVSHKKTVNLIVIIGFSFLYIGFYNLIRHYASESLFRFLIIIVSVSIYHCLCENSDSKNRLLYKYQKIICVIAFMSMLFWLLGSILGVIHPTTVVHSSWNSSGVNTVKNVASYYGLYFETQSVNFLGFFNIVRNTAIFTEAPMCSFHFVLAFLIELFLKNDTSLKKVLFLLLAVITTFSTTGIITTVIAITIKVLLEKPRKSIWGYIRILIIPVVLVVAIATIKILLETRIGTRSGSTRIDDFVAGYQAWRSSPIFGHGYGNAQSYQQYMSSFRKTNDGFSNSLMLVLAYGGIYLLLPYLYAGVLAVRNCLKEKNSRLLIFFLLFVFMLTLTIGPFQALTIYLFFYFAD